MLLPLTVSKAKEKKEERKKERKEKEEVEMSGSGSPIISHCDLVGIGGGFIELQGGLPAIARPRLQLSWLAIGDLPTKTPIFNTFSPHDKFCYSYAKE